MGMWLFLFTELILFGGMFLLYSVYRFQYADEFHLAAKELNTIMVHSIPRYSYRQFDDGACYHRNSEKTKTLSILLQLITIFLALFFLVNKYFEWTAKFHHGIYPGVKSFFQKFR
jgi:cytochrome c oxidase subunit 3